MKATQRQLSSEAAQNSKQLQLSFKNTSGLAHGLTKERATIENEFQKIAGGKSAVTPVKAQLEKLKTQKAVKEPILTAEEKASLLNEAEIKGTGFIMSMTCSDKGRAMIEDQRDTRRQRHLQALKESEKFIDQFYDNFCERKNEIRERSRIFTMASDAEIAVLMASLTDQALVSNEVTFVNGVWDKVQLHRTSRKADTDLLRENLDKLKAFQAKGSTGFLSKLRDSLVFIAFLLEPAVEDLMLEFKENDCQKYVLEHQQLDEFAAAVVESDKAKFQEHYDTWKEAVVRFHKLKQEDAIQRFLQQMDSMQFVNPETRQQLFLEIQQEQRALYEQRAKILAELDNCRPTQLTANFVNQQEEKLRQFNEESSVVFDRLVDRLARDMDNTNEDIDIAEYDLRDFILKNDAQLPEGLTFDLIMEKRVAPTVARRKKESKTLITNSILYLEQNDFRMQEICAAVILFFKQCATKLDANKEKLKKTEQDFQVSLAQCGDHHDDLASAQEEQLTAKVDQMKKAIHHVMLNTRLEECFEILDQIQRTYRNYNEEYCKLVQNYPQIMTAFFDSFESDLCN